MWKCLPVTKMFVCRRLFKFINILRDNYKKYKIQSYYSSLYSQNKIYLKIITLGHALANFTI